MDAAGARRRVKRLTALIEGLTNEEEAMQAGLGVLTREEWTEYLAAIWSAKEALEDARKALQMAARKR
jgi:phosphopantetheinyl transferase (holo-ACP synthase)